MNRRHFLGAAATLWAGPSFAAQATGANPRSPRSPDHAALLGQHDIVYQTPVDIGRHALPIGNGDITANVWMPPAGLAFAINKSNVWDDRLDDPPLAENWAWDVNEEERWSALVSAARLHFRSPLPAIDPLYLDDFEARLDLHKGEVHVESDSSIARLNATTFVSRDPAVLAVRYEEEAYEPVEREIELSRWGSRRFFHWYSQYVPGATDTGLDGTRAGADGEFIWIEQKLRAISFAVVARFVGHECQARVKTSHAATLTTKTSPRVRGTLYLAIVTSEEDSQPLEAARRQVEQAAEQELSELQDSHRRRWAGFWSKSFVQIPQDYLENLYYFSLYSLASSSQGEYPPHHCGGFWFWNHDIRRWGHYYHWNVQQQYWPVHASNHAELIEPYLNFRFETLPQARDYAKQVHNRAGALYSDVTDRWGRGTIHSHVSGVYTTSAQIAMDFWRHYAYTQDLDFLRERAYVMMREAVLFYLETVNMEPDGMYHIPHGTCYENSIQQKDAITDLSMIRALLPRFVEASELLDLDADLRGRCRDIVEKISPFFVLDDATDENGRELGPVFSSGIPLQDTFAGPDFNHRLYKQRAVKQGERMFNISFFCETSPVFPSGVIGLSDRDSKLFPAAQETVKELQRGPSWNLHPIISAARLGMSDVAMAGLTYIVERFQQAPQGFFAELTLPHEYSQDYTSMARPAKIIDGRRTDERAELPNRWFDSPDLEIGGVLMTAINEMLLQSHDGTIRICPALPEDWKDVSFQLRASGAFLVTAAVRGGVTQPFVVDSLAGKRCRIESPWDEGTLRVRDLSSGGLLSVTGETVEFDTTAGGRYLVFREGVAEQLPEPLTPRQQSNGAPKEWRGRQLGIPRRF